MFMYVYICCCIDKASEKKINIWNICMYFYVSFLSKHITKIFYSSSIENASSKVYCPNGILKGLNSDDSD